MDEPLEHYRGLIDILDTQLVSLLGQRMKYVRELAQYKKQEGLPMEDAAREAGHLHEVMKRAQGAGLQSCYIYDIWKTIYKHSVGEMERLEDIE